MCGQVGLRCRLLFIVSAAHMPWRGGFHIFPFCAVLRSSMPQDGSGGTPAPPADCPSDMNLGRWQVLSEHKQKACGPDEAPSTCYAAGRKWVPASEAELCGLAQTSVAEVQRLLAGRGVAFMGDSIARHLFKALLRAGGAPDVQLAAHADGEAELPGVARAAFLWRPYPGNVTAELRSWGGQAPPSPARPSPGSLVLASVCLWHMLHNGDAPAFGGEVSHLVAAASSLVRSGGSVRRGWGFRVVGEGGLGGVIVGSGGPRAWHAHDGGAARVHRAWVEWRSAAHVCATSPASGSRPPSRRSQTWSWCWWTALRCTRRS